MRAVRLASDPPAHLDIRSGTRSGSDHPRRVSSSRDASHAQAGTPSTARVRGGDISISHDYSVDHIWMIRLIWAQFGRVPPRYFARHRRWRRRLMMT